MIWKLIQKTVVIDEPFELSKDAKIVHVQVSGDTLWIHFLIPIRTKRE